MTTESGPANTEECNDDCGNVGSDFEFRCYCKRCKRERTAADEIGKLASDLIDVRGSNSSLQSERSELRTSLHSFEDEILVLEERLKKVNEGLSEVTHQREFWKDEARKKIPSKSLWKFLRTGEN